MTENYYGYPMDERRDQDEEAPYVKKPDERKQEPLKQISGPKPKPKAEPDRFKKKF